MTHYTAAFSDGYVAEIKNSKRAYTHAWRATGIMKDDRPIAEVGFAGSYYLASKASQAVLNRWRRNHPAWSGPPAQLFPVKSSDAEIVDLAAQRERGPGQ